MNTAFRLVATLCAIFISFNAYCIPKLNSWPTATATIYLDFDGYDVNSGVWNFGIPFTCAPSTMNDSDITEVFNRVAEDYRPFNLNITTDSAVYLKAPLTQRIRVVVTPTNSWYTGVGGITYVNSFTWGDDTPCFVFCNTLGYDPKLVAECCSHESGHSLGLEHQSAYDASCNITKVYNDGQGNGEIGWAPIMGNSYYRNMSSWNNGPTQLGCNATQDNLSIITTRNGFSYRTDDFSDNINSVPAQIDPVNINVDGLISTATDKDAFKFNLTKHTNFHMDATPFNVGVGNDGADVDLRIMLYDGTKKLIGTFDPATSMSVTIDTALNTGSYYLVVDGSANANATDYNSIGSYKLRGASAVILPVRSIELTGKTDHNIHSLSWNIISDEPVKSINVEISNDGVNFKNLKDVTPAQKNLSYSTSLIGNIFYRLKVTSLNNEYLFSNVIVLKNNEITTKRFTVSTFINNTLSINALTKFKYQIFDASGKKFEEGNGNEGLNKINTNGLAIGMYILQIMGDKERQVERIIKQ